MKNAIKYCYIGALALIFLSGFVSLISADWKEEARYIGEVFRHIEEDYLYPIDLAKCRYQILKGMTAKSGDEHQTDKQDKNGSSKKKTAKKESNDCLDKYSYFMNPDEYKELEQEMKGGHFGGIGAEIFEKDGKIIIISPIENSPAEKAGLRPDDVIVGVRQENNKNSIRPEGTTEAVNMLRGPVGSKVYVTIERGGKIFEVILVRADIKTSSVKKKTLSGGIGYIEIRRFDANTSSDLYDALDFFDKPGIIPGVIIDLRWNPGGYLCSALETLAYFGKKTDDVMLTIRKKDAQNISTVGRPDAGCLYYVWNPGTFKHFRVVILVNKWSASASEIFAGTMQDWGHEVGGEITFGKGAGQTVIPLSDGSALGLTTFEFLVGNSKTPIQERGVYPNHYVADTMKSFKDRLTDKDAQFMKALEVIKKIKKRLD